MKVYTEKEAEDFLDKKGFNVSRLLFARTLNDIKKNKKKLVYPLVAKIHSKTIVHKHKINGIIMNINNYNELINAFNKLEKIKSFKGIIIQKQIIGNEFLLGLKKTPEFGYAIAFGCGKTLNEKEKNTFFRICPITNKDANELINEAVRNIKINKKQLIKVLVRLSKLPLKNSKIKELDINPLYIDKGVAKIADSQIVFE